MRKTDKAKLIQVFEHVRLGCSLYKACQKSGMSTKEFYELVISDAKAKEEFVLALSDYADQCMDDIRDLVLALKAGDIDNSTAKLLIETNKWLALKACPDNNESLYDMENKNGEQPTEIVVKFV